jgi:aminoglycoside phosphotransferase (APT) family kinase protein
MSDDTGEDARVAAITRWIERNLGGTVQSIERQARWRPAWTATADTADAAIELYVRSDREGGFGIRPLRDEYAALTLLEGEGIPVPRIYGWCDEPEAIVMASSRDAPFHGDGHRDPVVHAALADYMAILAAVHRIDVSRARAVGFAEPADARSLALVWFGTADAAYQAGKEGPEPLVEFLRDWILRNIPLHRERCAFVAGDAPQFFHDGPRVTALYDLELAHIGDPMMDLASVRVRDINEPIGELTSLFSRYVEASGEALDWAALDFHTVVGFAAVPMMVGATFRQSHPHPAFIEYLSWQLGTSRAALEVLAESLGVTLDPVDKLAPSPTPHRHALADLVAVAQALPPPGGLLRQAPALSLARYAQRADEIGPEIDRLELADAQALLGEPFTSPQAAEEALEAFVTSEGAQREAELVRFFHRRVSRRLQLLRDYPSPIVDRGLGPIDRSRI